MTLATTCAQRSGFHSAKWQGFLFQAIPHHALHYLYLDGMLLNCIVVNNSKQNHSISNFHLYTFRSREGTAWAKIPTQENLWHSDPSQESYLPNSNCCPTQLAVQQTNHKSNMFSILYILYIGGALSSLGHWCCLPLARLGFVFHSLEIKSLVTL